MRFSVAALFVSAGLLTAQQSPEMQRAQQEITRLKELVAAGAVARARLQSAQAALDDARDAEVLQRTLYGRLTVQDLTEDQSREMVEAAQRRFERQKQKLEQQERLVEAGVIARGELVPLREELESRRLTVELAHSRARLLDEIAEMARREEAAEVAKATPQANDPVMEHFEGDGHFSAVDLMGLQSAFQKKFHKPLPISANGETSVHRALGFDHRGRVDVAINPDQAEGLWLRAYLESNDIPYYAFRTAVPGKATGAHIHIGPGSVRLRVAD
jgi:hypothetical protein